MIVRLLVIDGLETVALAKTKGPEPGETGIG